METKASYVVVGAFSLLVVAAALLFVLWAAKNSKGDLREYEVVFRQSVAGLSTGSAVSLEGVRIGQVSAIKVSPADPGQVIVRVQVAADAPIRQNSQATLEPQGVTGMSIVAISGGSADSPLLADIPEQIERIPARPSKLQEIMNSVPSILASLDEVVQRANQLISPENTESFGKLLTAVTEIAETLAQNKDSIGKGMAGFGDAGQSFAESGKRLEKFMASAQTLVDKDIRSAAKSFDKASVQLGNMAGSVEPGLSRFSRDSVEELHRLLVEARQLMTHLSSLTQKLESDPRRFLLGNPVPEFSVP
ncbi:putative Mammalian cell entry related domain protein [uncultured delta proteobacterium]|uniref:Putative Mammalian cell entry related domain protein n=1 Tax=uncultured delta proteobacterium TaxID=34034 RepID=A0A212JY56_9DELT|nr:putative Mammalian cell entry related domain protein [uncultured delta proteobacterium]